MDREDSVELDLVNSVCLGDDSDLTSLALLCYGASGRNSIRWL
jgi:hypothetical protein